MPQVLELARGALGTAPATPMTPEFWTWKHADNPFGQSYGIYAWDEVAQRAAGVRMFLRWRFVGADGVPIRAVRAVDTATHAGYRRQGLFARLTRQAIEELSEEGIGLIFNTPNESSLPGYLKMGWRVVANLLLFVRPLRPARMLARRVRHQTEEGTAEWEKHFTSRMLHWPEFTDEYGDKVDELAGEWERARRSTGLRTARDRAYLDWRYGGHPHVEYGACALTQGPGPAGLLGFAVVRPNTRYGWQEAVLDEVCLARPDPIWGRRLLRELVRCVRSDYIIAHFADGSFERGLLRGSGFWRVPRRGMLLAARTLGSGEADVFNPQAWDLTLGDLELF